MRLSALAIAGLLLVSVPLLAQRGGGGASSGGSHSGGGFSGGGSSGGSFHGGPSGSAGSSGGSMSSSSFSSSARSNSGAGSRGSSSQRSPKDPPGTGLNIRPNLLKSPVGEKLDDKPEKKGVFSFLHHKKPAPEPAIATNPPFHCKPGRSCMIPLRTACTTGRVWNTSSCAQYDQYSWFNGCRALADQLATEQEWMRLRNDPGENLRYQMLINQYRQCVNRFGAAPFSSYLFSDGSLSPYF